MALIVSGCGSTGAPVAQTQVKTVTVQAKQAAPSTPAASVAAKPVKAVLPRASAPVSKARVAAPRVPTTAGLPVAPKPVATFADVVARVRSGIVQIDVSTCSTDGVGTGFLVGPRLVATVQHVVAG